MDLVASREGCGGPGKTIMVLGGGAALGAHQAGALGCLIEAGIRPDAIIGSSIGIINALLFASGGMDAVRRAWLSLSSWALMPGISWRHNPLFGNSLMSMESVVRWLERSVDFESVFEGPLELKFVLLNLSDGRTYLRGNRTERELEAFRTAAHIGYRVPGLFPPITFEGDQWCDGGFAWNLPLEHAIEMGASEVYILSVISRHLPRRDSFPTVAHVSYRMAEVLWATQGNSSRLRALTRDGNCLGARLVEIEPSEYQAPDPLSMFWTSPSKARRLMELGRRDAARVLNELAQVRSSRDATANHVLD